jgi:hypothetical protein
MERFLVCRLRAQAGIDQASIEPLQVSSPL